MFVIKRVIILLVLTFNSHSILALEFSVFGDVSFQESTTQSENASFALGGLDLYATQKLSENTRGFIQLVFEDNSSGTVADLERFWIMRQFSDEFNLSAGRFHTPLGRWNRTYHHGALIQDTISRPFFLDFEDVAAGVLPVHIVGIMLTGDFIRPNDEINYELAIGNGPSIDTSNGGLNPTNNPELDINVGSDNNSNKSIVARVVYGHDSSPLKVGAFAMTNEVAESATSGGLTTLGQTLVSQNIYGLDIIYTQGHYEFLAEYYQIDNTNKVANIGSYSANAWYAQLAYKFNPKYKIIFRTESLSFDETNDTYFRILSAKASKHNVVTLRYEVDDANALKFEIDAINNQSSADSTLYRLQWSFLFQ